MHCGLAIADQTCSNSLSFLGETFSIFLGDVCAAIFLSIGAYLLWYLLKYPGFQVGAEWTLAGWDASKMGRFPNDSDTGQVVLMPNVSVVTRDTNVQKIISAVRVCERADITDPGEILGHIDLQRDPMPVEHRTTGGDLVRLAGPRIECAAKDFRRITSFPVFIQTSDGEFYQATSPGNEPKGIVRLRLQIQKVVYEVKQRIRRRLG
jgi:hypothetical protein